MQFAAPAPLLLNGRAPGPHPAPHHPAAGGRGSGRDGPRPQSVAVMGSVSESHTDSLDLNSYKPRLFDMRMLAESLEGVGGVYLTIFSCVPLTYRHLRTVCPNSIAISTVNFCNATHLVAVFIQAGWGLGKPRWQALWTRRCPASCLRSRTVEATTRSCSNSTSRFTASVRSWR